MTDKANGQLPDGAMVRKGPEPGETAFRTRFERGPDYIRNAWREISDKERASWAAVEKAVLDRHSTPVLESLHREIDKLREIVARRDSQLAAAGVPCAEIPEGMTPPGVLQAYSDAHRRYPNPRDALQAHAAGLRAALILDRKQCPRVAPPVIGSVSMTWKATKLAGIPILLEAGERLFQAPGAVATPSLPPYSPEIGAAADRYLMSVAFRGDHILPAMFRWGDCWRAMVAAAPPVKPFRQDPHWTGMSLGMDGAILNLKIPEGSAEIVIADENLEFLREEGRDLWIGRLSAADVLDLRRTLNEYLPPDVPPPWEPLTANRNGGL